MFKQIAAWLKLNSSSRQNFCLTLLLLLSISLEAHESNAQKLKHQSIRSLEQLAAPSEAGAQNATVVVLAPGRPTERKITVGQTQSYQVAAAAGQFVGVAPCGKAALTSARRCSRPMGNWSRSLTARSGRLVERTFL